MRRILISQNENNDNTDYVVENGKLVYDKAMISDLHVEVTKSYLEGDLLYKNDNLKIKRLNDKVIIQSHYVDVDVVGRRIFYMFYVEKLSQIDVQTFINLLKKDSKVISRTIDENDENQIKIKLTNTNIELLIAELNKYKVQIMIALLVIIGAIVWGSLINKT